MKIEKMNKPACQVIKNAILKALKEVESEYGVKIDTKGGRFTDTSFTFPMEISVIKNGKVLSKEATAFSELAELYGFKKTDLGRTFKSRVNIYEITGISTRNRKYKLLAKRSDGFKVKFVHTEVARLLNEEQRI